MSLCRGVELGGDAIVSLPISSDYQTVPSNNFDQTIKYMCMFLQFQTHLKGHTIDIIPKKLK